MAHKSLLLRAPTGPDESQKCQKLNFNMAIQRKKFMTQNIGQQLIHRIVFCEGQSNTLMMVFCNSYHRHQFQVLMTDSYSYTGPVSLHYLASQRGNEEIALQISILYLGQKWAKIRAILQHNIWRAVCGCYVSLANNDIYFTQSCEKLQMSHVLISKCNS